MVVLHRMRLRVEDSSLIPVLDSIRTELSIPSTFPDEVDRQADAAVAEWKDFLSRVQPVLTGAEAASWPRPLAGAAEAIDRAWTALVPEALPRWDATDVPFVTIDPESSRDLDQAVRLSRLEEGRPDGARYRVLYAIASLATFVPAGSPLDLEVRRRATTIYMPDRSTPLHPLALSEGAASLLPGGVAPACVWEILLDARGEVVNATVRRALVRSRAKLSYDQVEAARTSGRPLPDAPEDLVELLEEIGRLRRALETARGGVSSPSPEQEITREIDADGSTHYELSYRKSTPVEEWNAQISLLTGMCAASIMREAGIAVLRTAPPASHQALERLHGVARLLGVDWPEDMPYARLLPALDPAIPAHTAFLAHAMSLYRGAEYAVFVDASRAGSALAKTTSGRSPAAAGAFPCPGDPAARHAAIAAEYAHVTAPLRRLVDRWASEICIAHESGRPIPGWVLDSLPDLPGFMAEGARLASAAERAAIGAVSAKLLLGHEGATFRGVIVERRDGDEDFDRGKVLISDPAVIGSLVARVPGARLPLGEEAGVVLERADVESRSVRFTWAP